MPLEIVKTTYSLTIQYKISATNSKLGLLKFSICIIIKWHHSGAPIKLWFRQVTAGRHIVLVDEACVWNWIWRHVHKFKLCQIILLTEIKRGYPSARIISVKSINWGRRNNIIFFFQDVFLYTYCEALCTTLSSWKRQYDVVQCKLKNE